MIRLKLRWASCLQLTQERNKTLIWSKRSTLVARSRKENIAADGTNTTIRLLPTSFLLRSHVSWRLATDAVRDFIWWSIKINLQKKKKRKKKKKKIANGIKKISPAIRWVLLGAPSRPISFFFGQYFLVPFSFLLHFGLFFFCEDDYWFMRSLSFYEWSLTRQLYLLWLITSGRHIRLILWAFFQRFQAKENFDRI